MATIKAGTYRFNDVLTMFPLVSVGEDVQFTFQYKRLTDADAAEVFAYASEFEERVENGWEPTEEDIAAYEAELLRVVADSVKDNPYEIATASRISADGSNSLWFEFTIASGEQFGCYVYDGNGGDDGSWDKMLFSNGDVIIADVSQTIAIPNDTEVSAEFAEWFSANAVEVVDNVQISGKWKFKDVLTIPTADYIDEQIDFSVAVDYMGEKVSAFCDGIQFAAVGYDEDWRLIYNCITPPFAFEVYVYWNTSRRWEDMFGEGIKTINFGTEPQTVSAEFYNWLTANASQPMASITHNGEEIASLFPGQTATLKCAGMKMESDVVIEAAEVQSAEGAEANIVPLLVGEPGTYDANSPVIVTETFTGGGTPDVVYNFWGTNIPYFKAKKLVATKDIFYLAYNEDLVEKLYADLFGDVTPICQLNLNRGFSDTSLVAMASGVPAAIWVIATDETDFTKEAGFEDGGVYIIDAWSLMGAEGAVSLTALGIPDKPADGFMPVNVEIPMVDELVIPADFSGRDYNDGPYRRVVKRGMISQFLTVTPTAEQQIFYSSDFGDGYYIAKVIVEPMDISDVTKHKVLCGIYWDVFPQTEYVYGEVLNLSGSALIRTYTNGEYDRLTPASADVYGWDKVKGPGDYILTLKQTVNGIEAQTTFQIRVTAP